MGVQALRGLAACMVVAFHATQVWSQHVGDGVVPTVWANGAGGVDLFFVISGFVMTVSTVGREHRLHPAWDFLKRRLVRIVPLYWIMTLMVLAKLAFINRHPQFENSAEHLKTPLSFILASLTFVPYRTSMGDLHPLVGQGWTLSFEMLFYLIFAMALALRVRILNLLTPVMIFLAAIGIFYKDSWPPIMSLTDPILLEFLAGVGLGYMVLGGRKLHWRWCVGLLTAGLLALLAYPPLKEPKMRVVMWGIPAYLIVQSAVMLEGRFKRAWPKWILLLGDASYSLYLTHLLMFAFIVKVLVRGHVLTAGVVRRQDELVSIVVSLTVCVLVGVGVYLCVERPINNGLRRALLHERKRQVEAAS